MRYASIRKLDISNGEEIGVALFVQGCEQHCFNCFNPETWNFEGGKEWNDEIKNQFLALINRPYIKRVTILGGEPLATENICDVYSIVLLIKKKYPDKKIWLYTGKTLNELNFSLVFSNLIGLNYDWYYNSIIKLCDVIVDGAYIDELRDLSLPFRGSSNQRLIDVKNSIKAKRIILYSLKSE